MKITKISPFSKTEHTLDLPITEEQIGRWKTGEHVQNVFPNLSEDEREFLMTGITKEEWDNMFGEPEQHDEDEENSDY